MMEYHPKQHNFVTHNIITVETCPTHDQIVPPSLAFKQRVGTVTQ